MSRYRDEREEGDARLIPLSPIVDLGTSNTQSVVTSFHATISQDQTDQEALEGHRLVALQPKSELNNPLDSVRLLSGLGEREDRKMSTEGPPRRERRRDRDRSSSSEDQGRRRRERRRDRDRSSSPEDQERPRRELPLTAALAATRAATRSMGGLTTSTASSPPTTSTTSSSPRSRSLPENEDVPILPSGARVSASNPRKDSDEGASRPKASDEPHARELIRKLRGEIDLLKKENLRLKGHPQKRETRSQNLFRVEDDRGRTSTYVDQPHWVKGDIGSAVLQGRLPVSSIQSYLGRNPEVAFIVFQTTTIDDTNHTEDDLENVKWLESIQFTSSDMIKAVKNANYSISMSLEGPSRTDMINTQTELPAPYLPFFHYRRTLEGCNINISKGPRRGWQLLWKHIFENYGDEYMQVERLLKSGAISRACIKYLIKHNDILLSRASRHLCGYQAVSEPYVDLRLSQESQQAGKNLSKDKFDSQTWKVSTKAWEFDGNFEEYSWEIRFTIPSGHDEMLSIKDLELVPIQYAEPQSVMRLRDRGLQFWKSRSRRYISYRSQQDTQNTRNTDLRYMIDPVTYKKLHNSYASPLRDGLGQELFSAEQPPADPFPLLLPATINGFNMRNKKWEELDMDRISDVCWNTEAFDNLVIDDTTRKLIKALVMRQLEADKGTDLIAGKGQGLIILLHGGPGTGKTFTAESVAEIAKKPLYRVSCGDLGTDPTRVEEYLESVLYLGKIWDCVVLLDEADVYLEQRSMESLARNALVSVFLRVIEYHDGILILTSNRVGTFDEAFKSRLQLALHYEKLKLKDRRKIWENFIKRLETLEETAVDFDDLYTHVNDLAKHELNGRQIRNAITTARQLALYEEKELDFNDLQQVIKVALKFDKYTTDMQEGRTDDEVMRSEGVRG